MKKQSAMGGGEFEFNPKKLDEKYIKRTEIIETGYEATKNILNGYAMYYQKSKLGTFDNFKEAVLQKLIKDFRGRE